MPLLQPPLLLLFLFLFLPPATCDNLPSATPSFDMANQFHEFPAGLFATNEANRITMYHFGLSKFVTSEWIPCLSSPRLALLAMLTLILLYHFISPLLTC